MARRGDRGTTALAGCMLLLAGCSPDPAGIDGPEVDPAREPATQAPPGTEDAAGQAGEAPPSPGEGSPR